MRMTKISQAVLVAGGVALAAAHLAAQQAPELRPHGLRDADKVSLVNASTSADAPMNALLEASAASMPVVVATPAQGPAAKAPAKVPAKAPATTPGQAAAAQQRAAQPPAERPAARPSTVSRRDPFNALIGSPGSGGPAAANLPPGKAGLQVSTVQIDGIVRGPNGMIAIVSNPQNRVYFLREGDKLYDGSVEHITLEAVSFRESSRDAFGKPFEREVTKRLYPSPGEQR